MTPYDETLRCLPMVMRRLRLRAGHKTQMSALRAIRKTGARITAARICEWESGRTVPSLRSLYAFLLGLGYDLKALQDEVDQVASSATSPPVPENAEQHHARRLRELEVAARELEKFSRP